MANRSVFLRSALTLAVLPAIALLAPAIGLAQGSGPVELRLSDSTGLPIIYPYHGMILNHDLTVIPPTTANVLALFQAFSSALAERQSTDLRETYESLTSQAHAAIEPTPQNSVAVEAALVRWLIANIGNEQRSTVDAQYRPVEAWAGFGPGQAGALNKFQANPELSDALVTMDLLPPDITPKPSSYIELCRSQGVPVPPDWGDGAWQLEDTLDSKYTFAGNPANITQVWAYEDSAVPGACVALPRRDNVTNEIGLLGIICQSATTGAACFWDNIDRTTGKRLTGPAGEAFRIDSIQDGSNVAENCTNCHRGYNVFLIHPGTALDLEAKYSIDPASRYLPVSGQATWGNPGPLITAGTKPCALCHELPELGQDNNTDPTMPSAYCQILRSVVNNTMPSLGSPAGWSVPDPKYAPHVDFLREKCKLP